MRIVRHGTLALAWQHITHTPRQTHHPSSQGVESAIQTVYFLHELDETVGKIKARSLSPATGAPHQVRRVVEVEGSSTQRTSSPAPSPCPALTPCPACPPPLKLPCPVKLLHHSVTQIDEVFAIWAGLTPACSLWGAANKRGSEFGTMVSGCAFAGCCVSC
jgi:hypothetical protein